MSVRASSILDKLYSMATKRANRYPPRISTVSEYLAPHAQNIKPHDHMLYYLLFISSCIGLYTFKCKSCDSKFWKYFKKLTHVYQALIVLMSWYFTVDVCYNQTKVKLGLNKSLIGLLFAVFFLTLSSTITIFYVNCHGLPWSRSEPLMSRLDELWSNVKIPAVKVKEFEDYIWRRMIVCIVFSCSLLISYVTGLVIAPTGAITFTSFLHSVWASSAGQFSMCFICVHCIAFQRMYMESELHLSETKNNFQNLDFEYYGIIHQETTSLVALFSDGFGVIVLILLFCNLITDCVLMDLLVMENNSNGEVLNYILWTSVNSIVLCLLWLNASIVGSKANKPYEILCDIGIHRFNCLSLKQKEMLHFQQLRMGSNEFGVNIPAIGIVKMSSLGSVVGIFFTYFFLMLQFHQAAQAVS